MIRKTLRLKEQAKIVAEYMLDLEGFLKYKMRFIKELDETKLRIYWKDSRQ